MTILLLAFPWIAVLVFLVLFTRIPSELPPADALDPERALRVSVVIPARNEAVNIENYLSSIAPPVVLLAGLVGWVAGTPAAVVRCGVRRECRDLDVLHSRHAWTTTARIPLSPRGVGGRVHLPTLLEARSKRRMEGKALYRACALGDALMSEHRAGRRAQHP